MLPENYALLKGEIPDIADKVKLFPEHLQEKVFNLLTSNLLNQPPTFTSSEMEVSLSEETDVRAASENATRNHVEEFKEFVRKKDPQSKLYDMEFCAVVAYFFATEAPPEAKQEYIDKKLLLDAVRHANRKPPKDPTSTLTNAKNKRGYLELGTKQGRYILSAEGEYFVRSQLPKQ